MERRCGWGARRLHAAALALGVVLVVLVPTAALSSYLIRLLTALAGAVLLVVSARRWPDPCSAWGLRLLATAMVIGAASGVWAAVKVTLTGQPVDAESPSEWLYLAYGPVALAGLLLLPWERRTRVGMVRAAADALAAGGAFTFLTLAVISASAARPAAGGLGDDRAPALAEYGPIVVTNAFAVIPAAVVATALSVLPHVRAGHRVLVRRVAAGIALLGVADIVYWWLTWHGSYGPTSRQTAAHEVALLVLLWAATGAAPRTANPGGAPATAWTVVLPYLATGTSLVVAAVRGVRSESLPSGQVISLLVVVAAVLVRQIADSSQMRALLAELTAREQAAQRRLRRDDLTHLPNRLCLTERLAEVATGQVRMALAVVDIRGFRTLNDNHGHEAGDELLRRVGERLSSQLPHGTFVARAGADEFAVLAACEDRGEDLLQRLNRLVSTPVTLRSGSWPLSASIGMTLVPVGRPADGREALIQADLAVQVAKEEPGRPGSGRHVLDDDSRDRARRRALLREAVAHPALDHFHVCFQPIVQMSDGRLVAVETLLRWKDPVLGDVGPADFIAHAEQTGSIGVLTDHVLSLTAQAVALWTSRPEGRAVRVGINLSPDDLACPDLPERVMAPFAAHGVPLPMLTVEVTEEGLLDDFETAAALLARLQVHGVRVAVDDFGTGYASLRYLRWFRPDVIKIDREFVQAATTEATSRLIVGKVTDIAHGMGALCLAEGIETARSWATMRRLGLDLGQGYHIARPMRLDQLRAYLAEQRQHEQVRGERTG
jgi:diguanylate cyclase (GGDEF)-like protein